MVGENRAINVIPYFNNIMMPKYTYIVKCSLCYFKNFIIVFFNLLSLFFKEVISDDDDDEFNIALSSSVKKTKSPQ